MTMRHQRITGIFCKKRGVFMRLLFLGMLVASMVLPRSTAAGAGTPTAAPLEYRLKAAYLLNFCKFVAWPERAMEPAEAPIVLCILGRDPFGSALDSIAGKTVRGRSLEIRYATNLEEIAPCHLLFVSKSMENKLDDIVARTQSAPILTVGDMDGFAQRGGIINFFFKQQRIRFEINPAAAKNAAITISSQLLKLARITPGGQGKE